MRLHCTVALILNVAVSLPLPAADLPKPEKLDNSGFETVFDGKSLAGWHVSTQTGHSGASMHTSGGRWRLEEGAIVGPVHEYLGQEAVAVGVCAHLSERDVVSSTHRGHGHWHGCDRQDQSELQHLQDFVVTEQGDHQYDHGQGERDHFVKINPIRISGPRPL